MIEQLPDGNSIGWMQAPPQWIFSHTVRFVGIVRIVIQDGEGFILIKRGRPVYYYFQHGRIELKGHSALDYFNSHPTIEFNLCKYTPEEFALAMKICNIEEENYQELPESPIFSLSDPIPAPVTEAVLSETVAEPERPESFEEPAPVTENVIPEPVAEPEQPASFEEPAPLPPVTEPEESAPVHKPVLPRLPIQEHFHRPLFRSPEIPAEMPSAVPQPILLEESDIKLIGQIKKLNGVVAISVFNDERNILLMGDVDIEPLLKIARSMLATTRKISPHVEWGSFVHMTLQTPEGNIIIAPYYDVNLCLFTTRTINIGHIRRILRDLQLTKKIQD